MLNYLQRGRLLEFSSPLGTDKLLAMRLQGTDEISELFEYRVEVVARKGTDIKPAALVGQRVTMKMQVNDADDKRYFSGIVASLEATGGDTFFDSYRIRMVPALWLLSLNTQTRVFQDKTVLDIVLEILDSYSIVPKVDTEASYPTLEYCTQYRETDLHFVQRLLEQQGIFFYFTHTAKHHVMVLADSTSTLKKCPVVDTFQYGPSISFYEGRVQEFTARSTLITGMETSWDYRFVPYALSHASPKTARSSGEMGDNFHEHYDFSDSAAAMMKTPSGDGKVPDLQTLLQRVAKEQHEADAVRCEGTSTANTMQAGCTFVLDKYPQAKQNQEYFLTRVEHDVEQRPQYRAEQGAPRAELYLNRFEARPFTQAYRKERTILKPRVNGVVTGKVVTKEGEDSYLDKFGRVCVQFWWDRTRPPNTPDKTLLRVAQQWAGKGWGTYFWPRVGDEVLIDFLEGDPDAPIVVGSVYNGTNMPKYNPQTEYTRSGILTHSSKDRKQGEDHQANELRLEDKTGSEQIFLHAQHDMDHRIKHDSRRWVGNQDSLTVEGDQLERVGGNRQAAVVGNLKQKIDGSLSTTVGNEVFIQAKTQISLQVGETFITLGPTELVISGPLVRINSGGTPGVSLGDPQRPDIADDGSKGGKI